MIVTSVQIKTAKTQKHLYCPVFTKYPLSYGRGYFYRKRSISKTDNIVRTGRIFTCPGVTKCRIVSEYVLRHARIYSFFISISLNKFI